MKLNKHYNLTVGLKIREMREVLNMTREEFSEKCNISSSFLVVVESSKKAVTSKTHYKICASCNISAHYFTQGNNEWFETDMIIEMINTKDNVSKNHAIQILRKYIQAINNLYNHFN